MQPLADLWRRWGLLGLAGRAWSRSLGAVVDPQIVLECEVEAGERLSPRSRAIATPRSR